MLLDDLLDSSNLRRRETPAPLKSDGPNPERGYLIIAFDMNVRRFATIAGIEGQAIGTRPQHRRHCSTFYPAA
jgi:hypothetical protein